MFYLYPQNEKKKLYLLFGGTNNVSVFKNIMVECKTTGDNIIIESAVMFGVYSNFLVGGVIHVIQTCIFSDLMM